MLEVLNARNVSFSVTRTVLAAALIGFPPKHI